MNRKQVGITMLLLAAVVGMVMTPNATAQAEAATGTRVVPVGMDNATIGSGDGRIHIIPSLPAPSVKSGERLAIQAVVKATDGVASVTRRKGYLTVSRLPPLVWRFYTKFLYEPGGGTVPNGFGSVRQARKNSGQLSAWLGIDATLWPLCPGAI